VHESHAARHPRCEVASRRPEHEHDAAGHVLARVVSDPFDDGGGPGVADAESFADLPRMNAEPDVAP